MKKFISIVIAILYLMNLTVFAAEITEAANEVAVETTAEDVTETTEDLPAFEPADPNSSLGRMIYVLDFLKIIDKDVFEPAGTPTRADFVKACVKEYGYDNIARLAEPSGFTDVSGEDDGYISVAKAMGIVNGYTETEFGPNDLVTYFQGIKIVVSMLGYEPAIDNPGGYPTGYIDIATRNSLLNGISKGISDEPITNADMAVLLYNALEVDMLEPLTYGNDGRYTINGNTILESVLNVTKARGYVTANSVTSIDSPDSTASEGTVSILSDGKSASYKVGETDLEDMLGCQITYYFYQEANTDDYVVLGYFLANPDKISYIDAAEIEQVYDDSITYYREGRNTESKLSFVKGIRMIYNGKAVSKEQYDINLMNIKEGELKFVSSNGSQYDTVLISSYENAVVSKADADSSEIYFSNNKHSLSRMDCSDLDKLTIWMDGAKIELSDVEKGSIASIAWSLDKRVAQMFISKDQVSGRVSKKTESDGKTKLTIGETEYKVAYDAPEEIELGDESTFSIDAFGNIYHASEVVLSTYLSYAYVMDTATRDTMDTTYMLKVLDQSGSISVLELASKVRLNEVSVKDETAINVIGKDTLIQYKKNSDGMVNEVYTAIDHTNVTDYKGYDEKNFSKDNANNSMYFKNTSTPSFGGLYLVPEQTLIFNIPEDKNDKDYYMVTGTEIFTPDVFYSVELYDADKKRQVSAVVNRGIDLTASSEATLPWTNSAFVVQSVESIYHEERGIIEVVTGYQDGELVTIVPAVTNNTRFPALGDVVMEDVDKENSILFSDLKVGDVIQYKLNVKDEVDMFRVLYRDGNDMGFRIWNGANYAVNLMTAVAMVSYIDDGVLWVTVDDNASNTVVSNRVFALNSGVNVYSFNKKKDEVELEELENIVSMDTSFSGADKIFIRTNRDSVKDIVILKGMN